MLSGITKRSDDAATGLLLMSTGESQVKELSDEILITSTESRLSLLIFTVGPKLGSD